MKEEDIMRYKSGGRDIFDTSITQLLRFWCFLRFLSYRIANVDL